MSQSISTRVKSLVIGVATVGLIGGGIGISHATTPADQAPTATTVSSESDDVTTNARWVNVSGNAYSDSSKWVIGKTRKKAGNGNIYLKASYLPNHPTRSQEMDVRLMDTNGKWISQEKLVKVGNKYKLTTGGKMKNGKKFHVAFKRNYSCQSSLCSHEFSGKLYY